MERGIHSKMLCLVKQLAGDRSNSFQVLTEGLIQKARGGRTIEQAYSIIKFPLAVWTSHLRQCLQNSIACICPEGAGKPSFIISKKRWLFELHCLSLTFEVFSSHHPILQACLWFSEGCKNVVTLHSATLQLERCPHNLYWGASISEVLSFRTICLCRSVPKPICISNILL